MNKMGVVFLLIGTLIGFAVGYGVNMRSNTKATPIPRVLPTTPVAKKQPDNRSDESPENHQNTLLLQAIEELDFMTAERNRAREKINQMEEKVGRYDWLIEKWKEKGRAAFDFSLRRNSFLPSQDLADFLGWDEEPIAEIEALSKKTLDRVKNWESQNMILLEEVDDVFIYEISPLPAEHKTAYLNSMRTILSEDQMEIMEEPFERIFNSFMGKRTIEVKLIAANEKAFPLSNPVKQDMLRIHEKCHNERGITHSSMKTVIPNDPAKNNPSRWDHLFEIK